MVAQTFVWLALPTVVYGILASILLPMQPSRTRLRLIRVSQALAARFPRLRPLLAPHHRPPDVDPFEVLAIQVRLGELTAQLQALDADPRAWARARRHMATQGAYDALLHEACRLAGVDLGPLENIDHPDHREQPVAETPGSVPVVGVGGASGVRGVGTAGIGTAGLGTDGLGASPATTPTRASEPRDRVGFGAHLTRSGSTVAHAASRTSDGRLPGMLSSERERFREEMELASRGWSW